jgi:hypothetical protein
MPELTAFEPVRPTRPEKSEGGARFKLVSDYTPAGDQPQAIAELVKGVRAAERDQVLLGVTGSGKTFTVAHVIEQTQRPGASARPQQDAGRPALWRVPLVLSRQRGGVFRLLLRLLPARGLCAAQRHLYREGKLDQRADRPHAPLRHPGAAGARRRHRRGLGVVHLRHRRRRDLFRHGLRGEARRAHLPAPAPRRPGGAALPAQRRQFRSRGLPGARRHHRGLPLASGGPRLAHLAVRRRDRGDPRVRPADRRSHRRTGAGQALCQLALRDAQADAGAGGALDQAGPADPARRVRGRWPHPRSPAPGAAHHPSTSR